MFIEVTCIETNIKICVNVAHITHFYTHNNGTTIRFNGQKNAISVAESYEELVFQICSDEVDSCML